MKVEYRCCAGLDVHKRTVVACILKGELGKDPVSETKSFGTTTAEVMEMLGWLEEHGVTHVAMEATGNYWMPIYNLLEGHFELIVANAAHMKAVPGRKTDVRDAQWIADFIDGCGDGSVTFTMPIQQHAGLRQNAVEHPREAAPLVVEETR